MLSTIRFQHNLKCFFYFHQLIHSNQINETNTNTTENNICESGKISNQKLMLQVVHKQLCGNKGSNRYN